MVSVALISRRSLRPSVGSMSVEAVTSLSSTAAGELDAGGGADQLRRGRQVAAQLGALLGREEVVVRPISSFSQRVGVGHHADRPDLHRLRRAVVEDASRAGRCAGNFFFALRRRRPNFFGCQARARAGALGGDRLAAAPESTKAPQGEDERRPGDDAVGCGGWSSAAPSGSFWSGESRARAGCGRRRAPGPPRTEAPAERGEQDQRRAGRAARRARLRRAS